MEHPSSDLVRLHQLQVWLAAGWTIEEPVLQRSAYYAQRGRVAAFEVVVRQRGERRAIVLPDVPDVHRFFDARRLAVLNLD